MPFWSAAILAGVDYLEGAVADLSRQIGELIGSFTALRERLVTMVSQKIRVTRSSQ
jgi:hypothetical protein